MKRQIFLFALACIATFPGCKPSTRTPQTVIQLNWLHDPTFVGEYLLASQPDAGLLVKEGGPNIFSIAEVGSGRATAGIVGADIFLETLDNLGKDSRGTEISCFFIDFQRNPVGWVLHPDAAARAGLPDAIRNDPVALNKWLFAKFDDGTLKPGDKRGTETTSVWVQWRKLHALRESINVVPVGFDTSIVLTAPMLAYPVYLNEEPYKLSEKIGKSVIVFDPAVDGIELYGNVVITTTALAKSNRDFVVSLQRSLRGGWNQAKSDPSLAAIEVMKSYKGVSEPIVRQQLDKTLEFVFYGGRPAGHMDILPGGRWDKTLRALQEAGLVSNRLSLDIVRDHLLAPE